MKIFVAILVLLVVVASFIADHQWRKWIAARKRDRE
jgi:hypothetical protein